MNKVLIVTYYWPPGSGAGVQRWLKFSKYLPSFSWDPVILTVDPDYAAYPATDLSLLDEISGDLNVYRTKATDYFKFYNKDKTKIPSAGFATNNKKSLVGKFFRFIRGNFFIPDPRRGWNKFAYEEACRLIDRMGIKHIITTSPPHSTQLIGLKLKKKYPDITWIADLRDPWTDIYYYDQFYHTPPAKRIDKHFEKKVLRTADRIITVGKTLKSIFCAGIQSFEEKIEIITNGYDETDFQGINPVIPEVFTISYIGTLSESYPVSGFMNALSTFTDNVDKIKLRFIGIVSPEQKALILSKSGNLIIEFIPYVNHKDAIKYMMESSVLLLIIPDHYSNKGILTGKLFEYLATFKPILCVGPEEGDAADILRDTGHGKCAGFDDIDDIRSILASFLQEGTIKEKKPVSEFSRENLTRKLAAMLRSDKQ